MGNCGSKPARVNRTQEKLGLIANLYQETLGVILLNTKTGEAIDTFEVAPGFIPHVAPSGTQPSRSGRAVQGRTGKAALQAQPAPQAHEGPTLDLAGLARIYSSGNDISKSLSAGEASLIRLFTTPGAMLTMCSTKSPYLVIIYTTAGQSDLGDMDLEKKDLLLMELTRDVQECIQERSA